MLDGKYMPNMLKQYSIGNKQLTDRAIDEFFPENEKERAIIKNIYVPGCCSCSEGKELRGLGIEQLWDLYQGGNSTALNVLIGKKQEFIYQQALSIYITYPRTLLAIEDLVQYGNLGIMEAVEHFDSEHRCKFSIFVNQWIQKSIEEHMLQVGYPISIPMNVMKDILKVRSVIWQHPELSLSELAKRVRAAIPDRSIEYMIDLIECGNNCFRAVSLNLGLGDDLETELEDLLVSDRFVEDLVEQKVLHEYLNKILSTLPSREREVIKMRVGYDNSRLYTLDEIGESYGLTRERIRQIEKSAFVKLQRPIKAKGLDEFCQTPIKDISKSKKNTEKQEAGQKEPKQSKNKVTVCDGLHTDGGPNFEQRLEDVLKEYCEIATETTVGLEEQGEEVLRKAANRWGTIQKPKREKVENNKISRKQLLDGSNPEYQSEGKIQKRSAKLMAGTEERRSEETGSSPIGAKDKIILQNNSQEHGISDIDRELEEELIELCRRLPEREKQIITLRTGIRGYRKHSAFEVCMTYNIGIPEIRKAEEYASQYISPHMKEKLKNRFNDF